MLTRTADVVIIGGGVIGCSIAYQLAKLGIKSTVLERAQLAAGASGTTAGVVAPLWHVPPSLGAAFTLGIRSLEMFPGLADELLEILRVNPDLTAEQAVLVMQGNANVIGDAQARRFVANLRKAGLP